MRFKHIHFIILLIVGFCGLSLSSNAQGEDGRYVVYDSVMSVTPFDYDARSDSLLHELERVMVIKEILDSLKEAEQMREAKAAKNGNFFTRLLRYVGGSRKPKDKAFDCTVLAGPSYTKTNNFTIGAGLAGQYSYDRKDTELQRSTISAFFSGSVTGMVQLYVKTDNYLRGDRMRWDARLKIQNGRNDFWGIGYDNGLDDSQSASYHLMRVQFRPNFQFRVSKNLYLGPSADLHWVNAYRNYDEQLWQMYGTHQAHNIFSKGIGVSLQYDSRDVPLNAFRGYYVRLQQMVYPKFCNQTYYFNKTDVLLQGYWPVWRDCILAAQLHNSSLYGGTPPWFMLSMVGADNSMRGYYEGRYRDRNIIDGQVELRQHIWHQLGVVAFAGFANVFSDYKDFSFRETLPNYGVGVRWEFKPRMNIRVDVGFTKNKPGVVLEMNEAF